MNPSSPAAPTLDGAPPAHKRTGPRGWAALLFGALLAAVVWGSLAPDTPSLAVNQIDKLQHFGAYALLAALAHATSRGRSWLSALALVGLGVGLEFAQAAEGAGREGSWLDAAANTGGVLLATLPWPRRR